MYILNTNVYSVFMWVDKLNNKQVPTNSVLFNINEIFCVIYFNG